MKTLFDCYSRLLIDNHITDLKPEYMRKFDPAEYVEMVRLAGVEAAMVYASDHNGNCYYPSRIGHVHGGCVGRDLFGETVRLLAEAGIVPVGYHTVVYQNEPAFRHPEWRIRSRAGDESHGRYHYCCPNNAAYREFCREQIAEIAAYEIAGLFLDMTFWPQVCCCAACREKFGRPIPETVDWNDSGWIAFQRFREESLAEFARELTAHARECRPGIAVTHQFSAVLHGWYMGQSSAIAASSDYASGDFYGGALQQRLAARIFAAYSRRKPYEFMTSRCTDLHDHTSSKSDEELLLHAATTLANGGAYLFIDAINPDGTLCRPFYRRLGKIVEQLEPFRKRIAELRPELRAEVGLYFSMESCVNEEKNGVPLIRLHEASANNMGIRRNATLDEILGSAEILNRLHIPYRIVTDVTSDFSGLKALIVNHAVFMTPEECGRLRKFVCDGGTLIATGKTSLFTPSGGTSGNFQLADLFHADYTGHDAGSVSYLAHKGEYLSCRGVPAPLVSAADPAEVKGLVALPDFPADDERHYASIHSNPPGETTRYAGWIEHGYGRGRVAYLYSGVLAIRQYSQQTFGEALFKRLLPRFLLQAENFPADAEVTLLESEDGRTLLLGVVNYQQTLPVIPLREVRLSIRLPEGVTPAAMKRVSDGEDHPYCFAQGELRFEISRLEHVELFEIEKCTMPATCLESEPQTSIVMEGEWK